jgi:serine/threonine protein kinase
MSISRSGAIKTKPALTPATSTAFKKTDDIKSSALPRLNSSHYLASTFSSIDTIKLKDLGSGTYGDVVLAKYMGRDVAIKYFKDIFELFDESRNVYNIDSKHVVRPLGAQFNPPALMLEYLPNGVLEKVIKAQDLTLQHRLQIALDLACGIADMHKKNYTHRDITVNNVMCYTDNNGCIRAKLIDLGMSAFSDEHDNWGCTLYISPEAILEKSKLDPKAVDIYSLGVIFLEIMGDSLLNLDSRFEKYYFFEERDVTAKYKSDGLFESLIKENLELLKRKGRMTDQIATLILSCVQVDPAVRPSISQVTAQLEVLLKTYYPLASGVAQSVDENHNYVPTPVKEDAYYWVEYQLKQLYAMFRNLSAEQYVSLVPSKYEKPVNLQLMTDIQLIHHACEDFSKYSSHSSTLFYREFRTRKIKAAAPPSEGILPSNALALVDAYEHRDIQFAVKKAG